MLRGKYVVEIACDESPCAGRGRKRALTVEYVGVDASDCTRQARADGWVFHRDGRCTCPACSGKEKRRWDTKGKCSPARRA
jgi:hypothetical protein